MFSECTALGTSHTSAIRGACRNRTRMVTQDCQELLDGSSFIAARAPLINGCGILNDVESRFLVGVCGAQSRDDHRSYHSRERDLNPVLRDVFQLSNPTDGGSGTG